MTSKPRQLPSSPDDIVPNPKRAAQFARIREQFFDPSPITPPARPTFIGAQARKQHRAPGRANPPSLHTVNLARDALDRASKPRARNTIREDPTPITTSKDFKSGWGTDRAGDPRNEVEGWAVDGVDDYVVLRMELKRLPTDDKWKVGHINPVSPSYLKKNTYYVTRPDSPARARRHKATEDKKAQYIAALENGATVKQATRMIGMSDQTVQAWRRRDLDFDARYRSVMSGERNVYMRYDGTFVSARKYFFGYDSYAHHLALIDAIENAPSGGITLILLPPEAGKTSTLEDYCCIKLAEDPNFRILYISETSGNGSQAQKVLGTVKDRMTDPDYQDPNAPHTRIPEFISKFGPFHDPVEDTDKPWNQHYIKVSKQSGRRDYSLQSAGWKSRIYGARCDLLVFDDVQSEQSLTQTEAILRTIRKTFLTRPGKEGRTIFIGQMLAPGCLYERLIEEDMVDELVIIPALDEDGNSYCPQMWPVDALAQRRKKVGEEVWWAAYMQQPQLAQDATFTDELLDAAKNPTLYAQRRPDLVVDGGESGSWKIVAGLDPALGGGSALHIAAVNQTHFRVIDQFIDYRLMRNEDIFNRIKEACRYHFSELIVEKNSQQRGLARDDRLRELGERFGFRIVEHETGNNKWDFNFGVAALAGSFVRSEIIIPWADEQTQKRMTPLINELRAWRPNLTPKLQKQDMVMSMWFTWLWWQRQRANMVSNIDAWRGQGTPWKPGDMSGRWSKEARVGAA